LIYFDFVTATDFRFIKEMKRIGRSGIYTIKKDERDTNFAFFQAQNSDQSLFQEFLEQGERDVIAK
jgi:hypothetical protein